MPLARLEPARGQGERSGPPTVWGNCRVLEHMPEMRRALLLALARHGPQSVQQLAPQVFTSITTARATLSAMAEEGLVSATDHIAGRGRPIKIYELTEAARRLMPDRSGLYATALLRLMEIHEEEAFHKALDAVRAGTVQWVRGRTGLPPGQPAAEKMLDLAYEDGWGVDAVVEKGSVTALYFHCPVLRLAQAFPALCTTHRQTLSDVAGVPASLDQHLLAGDRRCVFTMRFTLEP